MTKPLNLLGRNNG